jgi:hypothetical protein
MASSYSGRWAPHCKACAENVNDGSTEAMCSVHGAMLSIPLAAGLCLERWKPVIDVMIENVPGVVRNSKSPIIQMLEADLNQVLRIAFAKKSQNWLDTMKGSSSTINMDIHTRHASHLSLKTTDNPTVDTE